MLFRSVEPKHFQPMNVNYGLFPVPEGRVKKKDRKLLLAERALASLEGWLPVLELADQQK